MRGIEGYSRGVLLCSATLGQSLSRLSYSTGKFGVLVIQIGGEERWIKWRGCVAHML